ncbi:unnamed protein product [Mytilus edulis]|uniref:Ig-like domain-containing protein n=1 Tax=Mytilus edulis TaxID=6550 RepID=A0A8S3QNT0_MYTED|nr:unnamed protein product [Mytilus edulis]
MGMQPGLGKVEVHQVKSLSYNSTESELDLQSDGSSKDNNESKQTKDNNRLKIDVARVRKVSPQTIRTDYHQDHQGPIEIRSNLEIEAKGKIGRNSQQPGFVSDVTVKRNKRLLCKIITTLKGNNLNHFMLLLFFCIKQKLYPFRMKLELTRGEKRRAQEKIKILEEEHKSDRTVEERGRKEGKDLKWNVETIIKKPNISGVLVWTVFGKVTEYGQNVTLFCNVSNCCPNYAGWDRWTPVQQTLFIDVKTGQANAKYDGKALQNGYTLVIQNLSKTDLNVSYSCVYGAILGQRKFLLEEDVFYCKYKHSIIFVLTNMNTNIM